MCRRFRFLTRIARFLERENFQFGHVDAVSVFCFVFGCAAQLVGSLFSDQELNPGLGSESTEP